MSSAPATLDLVWGADQIAAVIGRNTRITFYMLENGKLPARKVSGRWVAERQTLIRFFTEIEGSATAPTVPSHGSTERKTR